MTGIKRTVAAGFFVAYGAWTHQADAQSRSDLIEAARQEKEANLKPEEPSKPERGFLRVQESLPYRWLTGQGGNLGVGFGQIAAGTGFAIGPQYTRRDWLHRKLVFSVGARVAVNHSYLGRLDLSVPRFAHGFGFVSFSTVHRNVSELPYYGPGPESEKTGRSDYRLEDTNVELRPGFRPFEGFRAGLIGSFLAVNVGKGHSTNYISSEQQYSPVTTPGIDRQTNFWRGGGFVEYDWRDRPSNATSGGKYLAQYARFLDRNSAGYSFLRLDLDATQYVPVFNRTHVFALHGASSLTTANSNQHVPFYLQPTLGGSDTLRGYRAYRFYGDNSVLVSGEYRWEVSPIVNMVLFADGGKVFNRWEQWNLHQMESDVGFGFRFKSRSSVVFSFDTGFSHEGFQIWFRANNMF